MDFFTGQRFKLHLAFFLLGVVVTSSAFWGITAFRNSENVCGAANISSVSSSTASCMSDEQVLLELRNRVKSLDSLISRALKLDTTLTTSRENSSATPNISSTRQKTKLGIGGGDLPRAPIISNYQAPEFSADISMLNSRELLSRIDQQIDYVSAVPVGAPVAGEISSYFGRRYSPFTGRYSGHSGLDISTSRNTPVRATADGMIILAGWNGNYGNSIVINHAYRIETLYGHLSKVLVKNGQRVSRGEVIGLVGSTGRSTGPHVHYEVHLGGTPKDPLPFVYLVRDLRDLNHKLNQDES